MPVFARASSPSVARTQYTNVVVTKKLKSAGGTATPAATLGVVGDVIRVDDIIMVPITQFSFTPKQIRERFNGDENFLLRAVVTHAAKNTINIRFGGDTHVSPYPCKGRARAVREAQAVEGGGVLLLWNNLGRRIELECDHSPRMDGRRSHELCLEPAFPRRAPAFGLRISLLASIGGQSATAGKYHSAE
jgi:hypothetical protein